MPIFFDPNQARSLLAGGARWLSEYCDLYEQRMSELTEPSAKASHLWTFMPPPAYEVTFGLMVEAGECYGPAFAESSEALLRLDLGPDERAAVTVHFGQGLQVQLVRKGDSVQAASGERVAELSGLEVGITLRREGGDWAIAAEGLLLAIVPAESNVLFPEVEVNVGRAVLIMAQSLAPVPSFVFFESAQGERIMPLSRERNPYRFEWGLRSIRVNTTFIMAAVLRDLAAVARSERKLIKDSDLLARMEMLNSAYSECHARYLKAYMAWPRWRPGLGEHPECGSWDRNSFSNGVLPLSVALLSRLLPGVISNSELDRAIMTRSSSYFMAAKRLKFLRLSKGRDASWWEKRSANHGMIMMFTYLAATRLAGLSNSEGAQFVHQEGFDTLERLYADGSFCEGVHYNDFALAPCLPYLHLLRYSAPPERQRFLELLPRTYEWWSLSHDAGGKIFANFGDNVARDPSKDRVSVGRFLKNYADADFGEVVDLDTVDAFTPFSQLDASDPEPAQGLVQRVFARNQFAHATFLDQKGRRRSGLFAIGSRLQRTHNRNHDGLGFAFYAPDWRIGIDRADRQPLGNNGLVFLNRNNRPEHIEGVRNYGGAVGEFDPKSTNRALFWSRVQQAALSFKGAGWKKVTLLRWFLYRPDEDCPLIVATEVRGAKGLNPAVAFSITTDPGLEFPEFGSALELEDGTWGQLEALQIGGIHVFAADQHRRRPLNFLSWFGSTEESIADLASHFPWGMEAPLQARPVSGT